jgi:hypothetical protein
LLPSDDESSLPFPLEDDPPPSPDDDPLLSEPPPLPPPLSSLPEARTSDAGARTMSPTSNIIRIRLIIWSIPRGVSRYACHGTAFFFWLPEIKNQLRVRRKMRI